MSMRTDLAHECAGHAEKLKGSPLEGLSRSYFKKSSLCISRISLENEQTAESLGKSVGNYVTVFADKGLESYPDDFEERADAVAEEIKRLSPDLSKTLVVGLGNSSITPDSLGPAAAQGIFATRHIKKLAPGVDTQNLAETSVITTGVMGQTGFEASEIVKAMCSRHHFTSVIVIDALACSDPQNLASTIQLTDTGISPGSGVENARKELNSKNLGTNVIALGVPTVIDMETVAESIFEQDAPAHKLNRLMVTPRSIDTVIARSAQLISMAVNRALYPSLTVEEITALVQ